MGGRGAGSNFAAPQPIAAPTSTPSGFTLDDVQKMDDQQLHDFLIDVDKTDVPDFLNKHHLQKMVYALGMNDTPEIVSQKEFDDMTVNAPFGSAMPVIYRTVNDTSVGGVKLTADDICDMITDGDTTYMGNGVHGDGLYFSNDLSGSKAYGDSTARTVGAVLNSKAKTISEANLKKLYDNFIKTHPQTRKALGFAKQRGSHWKNSLSQFALTQGYNVITYKQTFSGETYFTVLDRSVLTMTRKRY